MPPNYFSVNFVLWIYAWHYPIIKSVHYLTAMFSCTYVVVFKNFFVIFFISLRPWPAHFITARNKQMWPTTAQTKLVGTVLTQTTATSQQYYKVRFHSSGTMHNLHSNFLLINYIQHNKTTLNHTDCSQGLQLDYLQNYVPSLSILYSPVNQCFYLSYSALIWLRRCIMSADMETWGDRRFSKGLFTARFISLKYTILYWVSVLGVLTIVTSLSNFS